MKLTNAQENELIVWEYFMPLNCKWLQKTDEDIIKFFEWSERGKHKNKQITGDLSYFEALRQGKRWAGIHIHEMYEKGILDLSMPYITFIEKDSPRQVIDFLKGEMFKGKDADLIERVYQMQLGNREFVLND